MCHGNFTSLHETSAKQRIYSTSTKTTGKAPGLPIIFWQKLLLLEKNDFHTSTSKITPQQASLQSWICMDIDILFVALFQTKISYPLSFTDWLCLHPVSDHYLHEVRRSHSLCLTRSFQKWCIMATAKDTWACGDNTGCWGRWFAWPGLCDLQQHRICKARAMGFGRVNGNRETWGRCQGWGWVWEACQFAKHGVHDSLCCTTNPAIPESPQPCWIIPGPWFMDRQ